MHEPNAAPHADLPSASTETELEAALGGIRRLFWANPQPMWIYDCETLRFVAVNDAACVRYGWSRAEFLVLSLTAIRPSDEVPRLLEHLRGLVPDLHDAGVWRHRHRDGSVTEVHVTSQALTFSGRPSRLVTVHDLTAERLAHTRERRSAALLARILESTPDAIAAVDPGLKIVLANHALNLELQALGGHEARVGDPFDAPLPAHPALARLARRMWRRALDGEEVQVSITTTPDPEDPAARVFEVTFSPVYDDARAVTAAVLVGHEVTALRRSHRELARHTRHLAATLDGAIAALAAMVERRDPYTAGHERRVALLAATVGRALGWPDERVHPLHSAGLLHDVGKIAIPTEILVKPGRLSAIEYEMVKTHAQAGYDILKSIDFGAPVAETVWQHHERLDGSGYPQGLRGDQILPEARILAIADVVESMASHRPYRTALGIDVALAEIERGLGTRYDPEIGGVVLRLFREEGYQLEGPDTAHRAPSVRPPPMAEGGPHNGQHPSGPRPRPVAEELSTLSPELSAVLRPKG